MGPPLGAHSLEGTLPWEPKFNMAPHMQQMLCAYAQRARVKGVGGWVKEGPREEVWQKHTCEEICCMESV